MDDPPKGVLTPETVLVNQANPRPRRVSDLTKRTGKDNKQPRIHKIGLNILYFDCVDWIKWMSETWLINRWVDGVVNVLGLDNINYCRNKR